MDRPDPHVCEDCSADLSDRHKTARVCSGCRRRRATVREHARYAERLPGKLAWNLGWRLGRYQLTLAEYDAMVLAREGRCDICGQPCRTGKRLAVDHDHRCCPKGESCGGCRRGLLCYHCNAVVVRVLESDLYPAARAYLESYDQ